MVAMDSTPRGPERRPRAAREQGRCRAAVRNGEWATGTDRGLQPRAGPNEIGGIMADPRHQEAQRPKGTRENEGQNEQQNEGQNEGEGSRTAARHYNEAQQRYIESGRVDE